jgi:predicted RNA-binding Zn-ribbon protein involved in translation (DUF1610 family)
MIPITIGFDCPMCGAYHTLTVDMTRFILYQGGMLIQDAFPKMSPTDRERFISGLCPDCQKEIFKEF